MGERSEKMKNKKIFCTARILSNRSTQDSNLEPPHSPPSLEAQTVVWCSIQLSQPTIHVDDNVVKNINIIGLGPKMMSCVAKMGYSLQQWLAMQL